jgi:hypothetical protein
MHRDTSFYIFFTIKIAYMFFFLNGDSPIAYMYDTHLSPISNQHLFYECMYMCLHDVISFITDLDIIFALRVYKCFQCENSIRKSGIFSNESRTHNLHMSRQSEHPHPLYLDFVSTSGTSIHTYYNPYVYSIEPLPKSINHI